MFWFDEFLPKAVTNTGAYGKSVRPYVRCSEANVLKDPDFPDISCQTEAFAYIQYVNYRDRWICLKPLKEKHASRTVHVTSKKNTAECKVSNKEEEETSTRDKPYYYISTQEYKDIEPKYTVLTAGK